MPDSILDVRSAPAARRHALIFDTFTALAAGGALELVDGHWVAIRRFLHTPSGRTWSIAVVFT